MNKNEDTKNINDDNNNGSSDDNCVNTTVLISSFDEKFLLKEKKVHTNSSIDLDVFRNNIAGNSSTTNFTSIFGTKPLVYADWIASGKSYKPIEEFISSKVLPFYANTHTDTSITGIKSSTFREEARNRIMASVKGSDREDIVLFCGNGTTGVIGKVVAALGLNPGKAHNAKKIKALQKKLVVFTSIFEHHSNLLPFRESGCKIVLIEDNKKTGRLDLETLRKELEKHKNYETIIGSFSAASNITGIRFDGRNNTGKKAKTDDEVTDLFKKYNALIFWDYACSGPYVDIEMGRKDAIFLSPHKFLGGPGATGVLVCKKKLFDFQHEKKNKKQGNSKQPKKVKANKVTTAYSYNNVPKPSNLPGGGTVSYVTKNMHAYIEDIREREEAGTPNIIGCIRAGLAFQLKDSIKDELHHFETTIYARAMKKLKNVKNLILLGPNPETDKMVDCSRIPIFSFLIQHGSYFLHQNFVSLVLNDLYGIQTRSGCACAGMYGGTLFADGFAELVPDMVDLFVNHKFLSAKAGFTRFSLNIGQSDKEIDYILTAIKNVAENCWAMLAYYDVDVKTMVCKPNPDFKWRSQPKLNNNEIQSESLLHCDMKLFRNGSNDLFKSSSEKKSKGSSNMTSYSCDGYDGPKNVSSTYQQTRFDELLKVGLNVMAQGKRRLEYLREVNLSQKRKNNKKKEGGDLNLWKKGGKVSEKFEKVRWFLTIQDVVDIPEEAKPLKFNPKTYLI